MTDQTQQYKPGDTANGHILGADGQWTPIAAAPAPTRTKKPLYKRWWFIGLIAVLAIIIVSAVSGGGGTETPSGTTSGTETTDTGSTDTAEPATAGLNQPVRDGKFEFTVTGVETGVATVGDDFLNETAQGSYTLVTMTVTNIGDEPYTFFDSNQEGIDSQGRELAPDTTAGLYVNQSADNVVSEINPGNSITAIIVFDVPAGETLTSVIVHDSAFSDGITVNLQ